MDDNHRENRGRIYQPGNDAISAARAMCWLAIIALALVFTLAMVNL